MRRHIALVCFVVVLSVLSCSTKHTTVMSRFYHGLTSRYNGLYNLEQAYITLRQKQVVNYTPDTLVSLPLDFADTLYVSEYRAIIERCESNILNHSLRRPPKGKKKSKQREYNPSMYAMWLLLAKSQFYTGSYAQAQSTLSHMRYLYSEERNKQLYLLLWQVRCSVALGYISDADILLHNISDKNILDLDRQTRLLYYYVMAELAVIRHDHSSVSKYIVSCLKLEKSIEIKSRLYGYLALLSRFEGDIETSLNLCGKAKKRTLNNDYRRIMSELMLYTKRKIADPLLPFCAKDTVPDSEEYSTMDPFRISLSPVVPIDRTFQIDWKKVYTDTHSGEDLEPRQPYVRIRVSRTSLSPSEFLFRLSSLHFKHFTQANLYIQMEDSDALDDYSFVIRGKEFYNASVFFSQYRDVLKRLLSDGLIEITLND